ncbi:MAG: hypothetical protein JRN57_01860 [Nitrososphaerota archaeon]|nr:hypothetical protein [Nitrososphaerota archaeon]
MKGLTPVELAASFGLASSGFVFVSLVAGNYLVFSPTLAVQNLGSYLLAPVYFFSEDILGLPYFDEGVWAFVSFCGILLSLSALRARPLGWRGSLVESATIFGPGILLSFEAGVYFLIPSYFFLQVTNFVGRSGLGSYLTNWTVFLISLAVLLAGVTIRMRKTLSSSIVDES